MERKSQILTEVVETIRAGQLVNDPNAKASQKFFELKRSTDKKVIGRCWPQVDTIDLNMAHSLNNDTFPTKPMDFGTVRLHNSAKVSDFLSTVAISADYFFINTRALKIMQGFNLGSYIVHPAQVAHKDQCYSYHILQFSNNLEAFLDFEPSQFFEANIIGKYEGELEINGMEEFMKLQSEKYVRLRAGKFKAGFNVPDLFTIQCSNVRSYVSRELADALVREGLTGFLLNETTTILD